MLLPNFDAARSLAAVRGARAASRMQDGGALSGDNAWTAGRGALEPSMRDPTQQAYAECLAECRSSGGKNCTTTCARDTKPPVVYPSPSGPSPGVAACCAGKYSVCLAGAAIGGGPGAIIGFATCSADYVSCLQSPAFPCNLP